MLCYCHSNKPFSLCCEPLLCAGVFAQKAEQLMRSRYTAFVLADVNYLMSTHHKSTRPVKDKKRMLKWTKSVQWMGLQIIKCTAGQEDDTEGWVEFKATYIENGQPECIHENSYFVKEKGQWFYKDGTHY